MPCASALPIRLVLDTNVVLDCLVFGDPRTRELMAAIEAKHVRVLVHPVTIEELERVLAYPQCRLDGIQQRHVLNRYESYATVASMPADFSRGNLLLPDGFPRCSDRDDQPFLALAYHTHADALVTKDHAILKLRKKARRFGVAILSTDHLRDVGTGSR